MPRRYIVYRSSPATCFECHHIAFRWFAGLVCGFYNLNESGHGVRFWIDVA